MTRKRIEIPRYTVNIFFALLSAVVWILAYHLFAEASAVDLGYHFAAEILKDLGVVVAGLAIVDWLWLLFSGDPIQQHLDRLETSFNEALLRLESSVQASVNRSIDESTARLESKIEASIEVVGHARHSGVIRIDSDPTALDAGFPTDAVKHAHDRIDLCGMSLHSLFARGDFISTLRAAIARGCLIRICIVSPTNASVLENSEESARAAMPGQSRSVIDALKLLKDSLRKSSTEQADRLSLYVLQEGTMTAFISRIDEKMLVVPYLRSAFTMDSPAMLLEDAGESPVFVAYEKEFEYHVSVAQKID
jgi:hypothetical protein